MEFTKEINLSFKAAMLKGWTLLNDKVILGSEEILLSDIQGVQVFSKPKMGMNGVIQIVVNGKVKNLAYSKKSKEDGEIAIAYLLENYGGNKEKEVKDKAMKIQSEIDSLPYRDDWGTRKEIAELPHILAEDEEVKAMTSGLTEGNTWLMVCTNKRVLMLDRGMLYGLKLIDIPLDRINSISHSIGLLLGKISITDGAVTRTIENISNNTVSFFADTVNKQIELYKQQSSNSVTQVISSNSAADELIKFKQLLDMGALTQEEFDIKKKELLGL